MRQHGAGLTRQESTTRTLAQSLTIVQPHSRDPSDCAASGNRENRVPSASQSVMEPGRRGSTIPQRIESRGVPETECMARLVGAGPPRQGRLAPPNARTIPKESRSEMPCRAR
jgi:hypothetical protein